MSQSSGITKGLELDETQIRAVDACCNLDNRVVAITGAAGAPPQKQEAQRKEQGAAT